MAVVIDLSLTVRAKLFRGLADPSRLAILEELRDGERTVGDLVVATGLGQANVSGHLACLRECGLVASRQEWRHVYYRLVDPRVNALLRDAEELLSDIAAQVYACTRYDEQVRDMSEIGGRR